MRLLACLGLQNRQSLLYLSNPRIQTINLIVQLLGICKNKTKGASGKLFWRKVGQDEPSTPASPQLTVWTNGFTTSPRARLTRDCPTTLNSRVNSHGQFKQAASPSPSLHTLSLSRRHSAHATASVLGFDGFDDGAGGMIPNISTTRKRVVAK